jgi:hypothetical protein
LPEFSSLRPSRPGVLLVQILLDIFHVNYLEYPLNCMCLPSFWRTKIHHNF